jgi:hypothetical protein
LASDRVGGCSRRGLSDDTPAGLTGMVEALDFFWRAATDPQAARFMSPAFESQMPGLDLSSPLRRFHPGVGFIKSSSRKIIAKGTNWRSLNELKCELKARG